MIGPYGEPNEAQAIPSTFNPAAVLAEKLQAIVDDATYADNYQVTCGDRLAREALAFARAQMLLWPDFVHALKIATTRFKDHPHWSRLEGTPWENDAPVIAADLMCSLLRDLTARLGSGEAAR